MTSILFFYALSLLLRPQRVAQTTWRIVRGRPFTWFERVIHEGVKQYVLRKRISRVARGGARPVVHPAASAVGPASGL